MTTATVTRYRGKPVLAVDGEPIPFNAYSPSTIPDLFYTQTARFFDHDTRVFFINVPRADAGDGDFFATPFWHGNTLSPSPLLQAVTPSLDEQAVFILNHRPDAYLFVRFPNWEPASWRALHGDELFVGEDGQAIQCPSLASTRYRDDIARYVDAVVQHCDGQPWADRVVGFWTGMRFEGTHEPLLTRKFYDHSPRFLNAWRGFLRQRYGSDAALREAYADASVTLNTVTYPPDAITGDFFQAPLGNAPYRDYLTLCRDLFAGQVTALCEAHLRANADGEHRRVFLLDTLKLPMQGWDNASFFDEAAAFPTAYHDMLAGSGHTDAAHLLDTPGLDGLITPHDYQNRGLGGPYEPEGPADSCALRGKLFLCEMDTRSYTGADGPVFGSANDPDGFAALTWRNVAASLTRGFHSYYMDVHTNWFADAPLHDVIHRQMQITADDLHREHADVPGIAVVLDDAAPLETNGSGAFAHDAVFWTLRDSLARCGVPVRTYLLRDLAHSQLPDHRVFYFPNLFKVDIERLELINRHVLGRNRVIVWGPGSGISDGHTLSPDHAARLTGFAFDMLAGNVQRRIMFHDFDHPLTRVLQATPTVTTAVPFGPALFPTDGHPLARAWTRQGRNLSGLAAKALEHPRGPYHSVFTAAIPLPPGFWRNAARLARGHVYCDTPDIVMADTRRLALHCASPGAKTLYLPGPHHVTDLVTGVAVDHPTARIDFIADAATTRLFLTTPVELAASNADPDAADHSQALG